VRGGLDHFSRSVLIKVDSIEKLSFGKTAQDRESPLTQMLDGLFACCPSAKTEKAREENRPYAPDFLCFMV
jgi:hypothetical protein